MAISCTGRQCQLGVPSVRRFAQPGRDTDVLLHRRLNEGEPGAHGLFRVMLMRLGVTEIGGNAIAWGDRDEAAEPTNHLRAAAVVIDNDGSQILGIQL